MRVQLTVSTESYEGVIYWQGQPVVMNGAGLDFFGIGLVNGHVKFRFVCRFRFVHEIHS